MRDYSSLKIDPLDPLIAGWAEDVLMRLRNFDEDAYRVFADRVFPPPVLEAVLKPDSPHSPKVLYRLLPQERFAPFIGAIVGRWPSASRGEVAESSVLLAKLEPDKAAAMFEEFARSENFLRDPVRAAGAIAGAGYLPRGKVVPLIPLLAEAVEKSDDEAFRRALSAPITILSSLSRNDSLGDAFQNIIRAGSKLRDPERLLKELFMTAAGELPFFDLARGVRRGWTDQEFSSLSSIFQKGAPLSEMDELCSDDSERAVAKALPLFPSGGSPLAEIARSAAQTSPALTKAEWREGTMFLVIGLLAASFFKDPGDFQGWDLERLLDYVTADLDPLPGIEEAAERLGELDPETASSAILARRSEYLGYEAAANLVWIMMRLNRPEFIPALIEYLGDDDDRVCETAMNALSRLGEPGLTEIVSRWGYLSNYQKNYGLGVVENVGGEAAADFLIKIAEGEGVDEDQWCAAARSVPDPRLLKIIEPELDHNKPWFDETFLTILSLNGLDHPRREEVRQRWEKERERQQGITDRFKLEDYAGPDNEFIKMELECPLCGKRGVYEIEAVFISPERRREDVAIGGEKQCLFCGEAPEFQVTEKGMKAVTSELVSLSLAETEGREYDGPLVVCESRLFNGKIVSLPAAIAEYRKAVEKAPRDPAWRIGLGNIYKNVGRFGKAKEQYREAIRLDPSCVEAYASLAGVLYDEEQFEDAFAALEKALQRKWDWNFHRLTTCPPPEFFLSFVDGYNELKERLGRPGKRLDVNDLRPETAEKADKAGRNDPCPCGSGKKYKKCCLNREE